MIINAMFWFKKKSKKNDLPKFQNPSDLKTKQLDPAGPQDLVAKEVHVCICDAQYMRNEVAWDEKYTGVRWDDWHIWCDFKTWRQGDPKTSTFIIPKIHQRIFKRLDHVWMSKTWPNIYG